MTDVQSSKLSGKKVAILAADGFERSELFAPLEALRAAGATVDIISEKTGELQAFEHHDKADTIAVDKTFDQVSASDYDAIHIPGGLFSPDKVRVTESALKIVREAFDAGKAIGAICHGPWVLINAGVASGLTLTSVQNIRMDLENAGAQVVDREVVVDDGVVTSRTPEDLEAFCGKLVEEIAEGRHDPRERRAGNTTMASPPDEPRSFA
ncbi:type 1 glutamine amidotransferase domain-containing protein [Caulobacter sp. NIBR2454]|uniref:type 1 glutamine amidotransferase domain-containing protein n=1 Tax=Caulobacter sp. NIBR2454 TaxID=3015996 RepID=UPI0022B726D6|nr:type 1 glutamine amidotransferase domain-containing protein [Caulobacter sp. NIBR2454]